MLLNIFLSQTFESVCMCMQQIFTCYLQLTNIGAASKAAMFCPRNNYSSPEVVFVPSTCANIQVINRHS